MKKDFKKEGIIIIDPSLLGDQGAELSTMITCKIRNLELFKVSEILEGPLDQNTLEDFINGIEDAYENLFNKATIDRLICLEDFIRQQKTIGRFRCEYGNSGVGVYSLDEVLEIFPRLFSDLEDWCYTIIKDFSGTVDVFTDSRGQTHIIGVGNKTFYSSSISW